MEVRNICFKREDKNIVGDLYLPDSLVNKEKYPVLILSHGFSGDRHHVHGYITKMVDQGYAVYAFDFCGGGYGGESDGKTTEMSVLTEKKDLEVVLEGIRKQPFCEKVILWGESQGGFVSAITASDHVDEVDALVLYYPAFVLQDDAKNAYPNENDIPETYTIMNMEIGRIYNEDARSFDVYDVIGKYNKNVLLIHGTEDSIVPIEYAEKAVDTYDNVKYIVIEGAVHGFDDEYEDMAIEETKLFLDEVL